VLNPFLEIINFYVHRQFDSFDDVDFGFPHFVFRDPEDVFRDFFGGEDPFQDLLDRENNKDFY